MSGRELVWGCANCGHECAGEDWADGKCPKCRKPYDDDTQVRWAETEI
jgi:rubrerythrin